MRNKFEKIFRKEKNVIIGMIHFPPLVGYKDYPGQRYILKKALQDLKILEEGGVDGILMENNYDIPHVEFVNKKTAKQLSFLACQIRKRTKLPLGICVLWNDYKTAFSIAKNCHLQFIRLPVFVDKVRTRYDFDVLGHPKKIKKYQKKIDAQNIALFCDIQVKHSILLNKRPISVSAHEAIKNGVDALIVTGKWTGHPPSIFDLRKVKKAVKNFPILIGSGTTPKNIHQLFQYTSGAIVGTYFKETKRKIKPYNQKISLQKVKKLVNLVK